MNLSAGTTTLSTALFVSAFSPTEHYWPHNIFFGIAGTTALGEATLAVAVDRSEGGTSLTDGTLELMVHRRLLFDDRE